MPDDELSPEEEAELEQLAHDVVDEAERVGVDWDAAQERMRALAEAEWTAAGEGTAGELTIGLDMSTLLDVLRQLPDGAGTARFLAAYEAAAPDDGPPAA